MALKAATPAEHCTRTAAKTMKTIFLQLRYAPKMMIRKVVLPLLFLSGCATYEKVQLTVPESHAATIEVQGNPSFWGDFFLELISLGFFKPTDLGTVTIRKVNGRSTHAEKVKIDPGSCEIGLILSGPDRRKSKEIMRLRFNAEDGKYYTVSWSQALFHEKWEAKVWSRGVVASAEGETFIPELVGDQSPVKMLQSK